MAERRFPFYREGQAMSVPTGRVVYDALGRLLRREWNPDREPSELEQALATDDAQAPSPK